ncbi:MAG TPA: CehA/McbA family metallohydrolase, partial [Terriglobia bacterium]|nr:CehA/McbA family metallohydrolase [Terriglobia bacterium]
MPNTPSFATLNNISLSDRPYSGRALKAILFLGLISLLAWRFGVAASDGSSLKLSIVDETSGQPTPARVEVLDAAGKPYVAQDALLVGPGYSDRKNAWKGNLDQALALLSKSIENPYTRTTQFYSAGNSSVVLPPGLYKLKLYKGTEYKVQSRDVQIHADKSVELKVAMSRWVDMPKEGWYSGDDHIHVSRPLKELNPVISKWMQAEDVHVANLLQFGSWNRFFASPQYEHGKGSLYREGNYFLASGQENPRTHFLGHTIILGQQSPLHFADRYVIYKHFFEEARRQGALTGYAHWGTGSEAQAGLAIDLPDKLLSFLEVLEAHDANYDVWYDILNTGFRLTPTAGTDYGSVPSLPGRERFYTEVKGPFSYEAWLDGIRQGKTFVTNGPVLKFHVQSQGM